MKTKVYTLAEVRKCEEEAFRRGAKHATNQTIDATLACNAYTLLNKMDFTPERLREFAAFSKELYEAIIAGYVTIEDILRDCEEQYNVTFTEE
jgi:hypothetical protein